MSLDNETPIFKAQFIKGFLESMEVSDSISKMQIQILKSKIEELIIAIRDEFDTGEIDDSFANPFDKDAKDSNRSDLDDDLPF